MYSNGTVVAYIDTSGADMMLRAYDVANATSLGSGTFTTNGIVTFTFTNPVSDTMIELQGQKTGAGSNPTLTAASIEFDT